MPPSRLVSSAASSSRALSLYRSLLRAARSLPSQQDRESLEAETKQRFRAEREKKRGESSGGGAGDGGKGGSGDRDDIVISEAALFDEAEARLYDARHHGIPHARLEHAAQIPRAVLESARELLKGGGDGKINLPRDRSARAKLEAAVERRRIKKQQLEEEKKQTNA